LIRHIVLVQVRQAVDEAAIASIFAALMALKSSIPGIMAIHCGRNVSPEGLSKGYTHAFTVDFADAAARDRYLADADHGRVGAALVEAAEGGRDGLAVIDIEA
jgi:hypothetical protein